MSYLQEFQNQINARNFPKFLQLWEEYASSDNVDVDEFKQFLKMVKQSDFSTSFGKVIETALPLWKTIENKEDSYRVLALLFDLETTNTPFLADIAFQALKERYGSDPQFNERIRIVGLRTREDFQGALSNYDLLAHMVKGKFVFHPAGWGAGEIMDISPLRQQVSVEFENVAGKKQLSFDNAFNTLIPLPEEHFLAQRFAFADLLEKEAKENTVSMLKHMLRDLGPQTASEIKDQLCDIIIPEKEWTKWWQAARSKLKKDPMIESPESVRGKFLLRKEELTQEDRLKKAITHTKTIDDVIHGAYAFLRDTPNLNKHPEVRDTLQEKLLKQLSDPALTPSQELQICLCLENQFGYQFKDKTTKELVLSLANIEDVINEIEIVALKKRTLMLIRECREDWVQLFTKFLLTIKHSAIREYLLKELNIGARKALEKTLNDLFVHPEKYPDAFVWYFQLLLDPDAADLPYGNKKGQCEAFESFLVLLNKLEYRSDYKDLSKKMYNLLSGKRYAIVRQIMEGAELKDLQEFILLASKCQTLSDHDKQIMRSLAAVVHPEIGKDKSHEETNNHVIWTTEEAFIKIQEKVRHIGTVEIVENAKEIEAARALGDLRENSEFKYAQERRARLQQQLRTLSDQIKHARVITKEDLSDSEVSVGSVIEIKDSKGSKLIYTILGPWDADTDKNILSFQSKLAQTMIGCKKGDTFQFKEETFQIVGLRTYLDK